MIRRSILNNSSRAKFTNGGGWSTIGPGRLRSRRITPYPSRGLVRRADFRVSRAATNWWAIFFRNLPRKVYQPLDMYVNMCILYYCDGTTVFLGCRIGVFGAAACTDREVRSTPPDVDGRSLVNVPPTPEMCDFGAFGAGCDWTPAMQVVVSKGFMETHVQVMATQMHHRVRKAGAGVVTSCQLVD